MEIRKIDLSKYIRESPVDNFRFRIVNVIASVSSPDHGSIQKGFTIKIDTSELKVGEHINNRALEIIEQTELEDHEYLSYARIGRESYVRDVTLPSEMLLNPFGETPHGSDEE